MAKKRILVLKARKRKKVFFKKKFLPKKAFTGSVLKGRIKTERLNQ